MLLARAQIARLAASLARSPWAAPARALCTWHTYSRRVALRATAAFALTSAAGSACALGLAAWLQHDEPTDADEVLVAAYRLLPWRQISRWASALYDAPLPRWARRPVLGAYARAFRVQLDECHPSELDAYGSVGELFARSLRPGARAVDAGAPVVSPVDGLVVSAGRVVGERLPAVKGFSYPLPRLLASSAHKGRSLYQLTCYLGPGDYHGFHAPADVALSGSRHIAGELLSVRPAVLGKLPATLAANERVILHGVWERGAFALAAVGATGVGSIELCVDPRVRTNAPAALAGSVVERDVPRASARARKGQQLGGFRLGSTVVLVLECDEALEFAVRPGERVRVGQRVAWVRGGAAA